MEKKVHSLPVFTKRNRQNPQIKYIDLHRELTRQLISKAEADLCIVYIRPLGMLNHASLIFPVFSYKRLLTLFFGIGYNAAILNQTGLEIHL